MDLRSRLEASNFFTEKLPALWGLSRAPCCFVTIRVRPQAMTDKSVPTQVSVVVSPDRIC